jgi:hypothetical protein
MSDFWKKISLEAPKAASACAKNSDQSVTVAFFSTLLTRKIHRGLADVA